MAAYRGPPARGPLPEAEGLRRSRRSQPRTLIPWRRPALRRAPGRGPPTRNKWPPTSHSPAASSNEVAGTNVHLTC
jgi:hypothetical protein